MKYLYLLFPLLLFTCICTAQTGLSQNVPEAFNAPERFSPERDWWNLLHYTIAVTPDYNSQTIAGSNSMQFRVLQPGKQMQIDLLEPMRITAIHWRNAMLPFQRKGNAYLVQFPQPLQKGSTETITMQFEGKPQSASRPPWGSGWIWTKDKKDRPWVTVTCEATGVCVWLPSKNVLRDEPDNGVSLSITVPDSLVAIGNGRLVKKTPGKNNTVTYTWAVVNPINNYNITPYIGKYVSWHENYAGQKGKLDCDYWVLDYNLDRARRHCKQADTMLRCFEHWMGPYPFYEDSYKLVEAPHPGMEHQSAIAYGNDFKNGYNGKDISGSGWGFLWDFILVHESGHEWFGNSLTAYGNGDSWIHEGFTKYLEVLYTTYLSGTEAGNDYAIGIWKRIRNDAPIVTGDTQDKYNKACALLHMIRQLIGDSSFAGLLRGLNKTFYHQTLRTEQAVDFINRYTGRDFSKTCNQYLRTTQVPVLEYALRNNQLVYRWNNCIKDFNMPVKVSLNHGPDTLLHPTVQWQQLLLPGAKAASLTINRNFYVQAQLTNNAN